MGNSVILTCKSDAWQQNTLMQVGNVLAKTAPGGPVEIELRRPKRSLDQNRLIWVLCRDFENQAELFGQKVDAEGWKIVLSDAFEGETQYLPKLDGRGMISRAPRTSKYPKDTFSSLVDFIFSEGAARGVEFSDESKKIHEDWC